MKALLINGSPHEKGCTYTALTVIANELNKNGVDSEIVWIGTNPVHGCTGCASCRSTGKCIYDDDVLNSILEKAKAANAYIFGAPVHYASMAGAMSCIMDRLFMSGGASMRYKPAACICSARRGGTTATYDEMNKYIGINRMLQVPSQYWNMVHGSKPEDVLKDEEGIQTMRTVAQNTAWLLKLLKNAKDNGIEPPEIEAQIRTNFIK